MYIVRDKTTKNIIHKNPAPLHQGLSPVEVYHAFDAATMEIGKIDGALPGHWTIAGDGSIRELTDIEKIAGGILNPGPDEKVVNGEIVPKTRQDRLDDGELSYTELRETEVLRLRSEVESHFSTAKTVNGYRLDNLARQKAAVSLQFRALADTDPQKSALLADGIIYADDVTDEIQAAVVAIQNAYVQAKAALNAAVAQAKSVAQFEAIALANYLS
ncbi:MAG: hypothetical protein NXI24_00805 [bacterium]|nr:hypothetical protein [bacterium]